MRLNSRAISALLFLNAIGLSAQQWVAPVESTLSSQKVTAIAETTDGYIWFGTPHGLNRYNGLSYTVFYQGDTLALSNDRIWSLCPDSGNRLWVGTESGINLIQDSKVTRRDKATFNVISTIENLDSRSLIYGCISGISIYDKATGESHLVTSEIQYPTHILVREDGRIIATGKGSSTDYYVMDEDFRIVLKGNLGDAKQCNGIAQASDGSIFFATEKGLFVFSSDFKPIKGWNEKLAEACGKQDPKVIFITEDKFDNNLVIGTANGEIYCITNSGEMYQGWYNISLNGTNDARCLITQDNIWISTDKSPLMQDIRKSDIRIIEIKELAANDRVSRLEYYSDNLLLVFTYRKVYLLNTDTGIYRDVTPDEAEKKNLWISKRLCDSRGDVWIVSNYSSITQFRLVDNKLKSVKEWRIKSICPGIWENKDGSISYLDDNHIYTISEGVRTEHPLNRGDSGQWRVFTAGKEGHQYFITGNRIFLYTQDRLLSELPIEAEAITDLDEDPSGNIWIGSLGFGVLRYDPKTGDSYSYGTADGLPDNTIRAVTANDNGVWVSTNYSITHISNEGNVSPVLFNHEGPMEYSLAAATSGGSTDAVFGGKHEIVLIHPSSKIPNEPVKVVLDAILVNNSNYPDFGKEITLKHTQNLLMFYYSVKDFIIGNQLNFAYKLEGHDSRWVMAGAGLKAFYSNLDSGKYRLMVKVQTPDGKWQNPQEIISVRIKPAWYMSLPAKITYLLLGALLLWVLLGLIRRNRIIKEQAERSEMEKAMGERMNKDKTDFFMNISHEYRTPLSLIYGPAHELARSDSLNEHDSHLVRLIERNTEKMMTLTEQVINFDRFSRSTDHLAILKTDLVSDLSEIISNFEYIISRKNLDVRLSHNEDGFPGTWCDKDKIEKIFFNLLSNAIKYTPDGGSVHVDLSRINSRNARSLYTLPDNGYDGDYAEISVMDTGIGIEQKEMDRIFERYRRLGVKVGDKVPEGLGIGLNHVLYLIELHRGAINVKSNYPKGVIFSFIIPIEKKAYDGEEIWHEVPTDSSGKITRIVPSVESDKEKTMMIVEDNDEMRSYLNDLFCGIYNVVLANDGEEAMKFIKISAPDMVVSDVMMPYKDGFQLCREIKESKEFCHLPVILLTAKSGTENMVEGLGSGADGYIQKPFDPQHLLALSKSILDNRARIQSILGSSTSGNLGNVLPELEIYEEEMGMSRSSLFSKVKSLTGQSPQEFLINYRLNKAKDLLKTRKYNISEVGYLVGFSTLNGFSRAFKNKFGVPPSSF